VTNLLMKMIFVSRPKEALFTTLQRWSKLRLRTNKYEADSWTFGQQASLCTN
jgi:hypothetical protein